ncbi:hypothetical protein AAG906_004588 [Vitis piasezkii]
MATRQVLMDLGGDPSISFVARLSFGTLESIVSHIPPMQDYTTVETAEVVVAYVHNLMRQRALLLKRLEVAKAMETTNAEARWLRKKGGGEAKFKKVEQENERLRKEMEELE